MTTRSAPRPRARILRRAAAIALGPALAAALAAVTNAAQAGAPATDAAPAAARARAAQAAAGAHAAQAGSRVAQAGAGHADTGASAAQPTATAAAPGDAGAAPAATDAAAAPAGERPYARPSRLTYVGRALEAVRGLGAERREALADELQLGARRRCRSGLVTPPVACLLDLAETACAAEPPERRRDCHLVADVILANQVSEDELVDEATRTRLVQQGGDYRAALRAELRLRQAALAAELALAEPGPEGNLPERIDRFCASHDRPLAWQRCAAAIVWYIGSYDGSKPRPPPPR